MNSLRAACEEKRWQGRKKRWAIQKLLLCDFYWSKSILPDTAERRLSAVSGKMILFANSMIEPPGAYFSV
jgi:hypothetical protein